ncbi:MAG: N-acetylmuramoyl-L-alanine amidase, partial [Actinobacteria bacterium]|nr:N-acetylmuramoyl-L-alanine amidase [Actinomycetota bacterium]
MMRRLLSCVAAAVGLALAAVVVPVVSSGAPSPATTLRRIALSSRSVTTGWHADATVATDLVGVKWSGDPNAQFAVSTRDASGHWNAPTPLGTVDALPDPGSPDAVHATRLATEPAWVRGSTAVRVTLVGGQATNVEMQTINAPAPKYPANSAGAFVQWPNVIPRAAWGADESLRFRNCSGPTYMSGVRFAVIHHTATSNNYSPADSPAIVRSIYAYSVLSLGYCDMMYNFLVDKYGQIFEGRYGGADKPVMGAHAIGFNTDSVGVAAIGDYSSTAPSAAMVDAIERFLAWKFAASGVDPRAPVNYVTTGNTKFAAGTQLTIPTIVGHRDTWFTECPGDQLYALLPSIRENVAERIEQQPMDTFPAWQPQANAPKLLAVSAYGGLYPAGGSAAFTPSAWWPGWPIVRAVKTLPGNTGGYVLDGFGAVHPFGFAPALPVSAYWRGFDIARDIALLPSGNGGYVLDGFGGVHPFGAAPPVAVSGYWQGWDIARRLVLLPSGNAGYVLDGWGGIHP